MFKRLIAAAGLVALFAASALAADLPSKAPATFFGNPCTVPTAATPLSCSGVYVGIGLAGQGSNADILGSGIAGSVFAGGIVPSLVAGYQYMQGNWIFGAEGEVGYAFSNNLSINGGAVSSNMQGARITEFFKVGGNLQSLLGLQSAPVTVPASLANSILGPYVGVGATQWQLSGGAWANGLISGAGVLFDISPHMFGDLGYRYTNFNGAKDGTGVSIQNSQSVRLSINYKF